MEDIVVVGGGGHAKVVINLLRKLAAYRILGYTDIGDKGPILGAEYLGSDNILAPLAAANGICVSIAVGQVGLGKARHELFQRLNSATLRFPGIVSPSAVVNEGTLLADAIVVMDGAVVNSGAKLGVGAIINTNSTVEHDSQIGDWVHVASSATISGGVKVGRFSMIGAGATIIEGKQIAPECIVGAGATVIHDLMEPGTYVGSPACRIR
jgi:sugar O-acyltransferase (sialic acid O-acetyltransferase NeuD family)